MTPLTSRRASMRLTGGMTTSRMSLPGLDLQGTAVRVNWNGTSAEEMTLLELAESQRPDAPMMLLIIEALIRGEIFVEESTTTKIEAIPSNLLPVFDHD